MTTERDEQGLESKFEGGTLFVTIDRMLLEQTQSQDALIELLRSRFEDEKLERVVILPRKDNA
jgi:hypothetical protein